MKYFCLFTDRARYETTIGLVNMSRSSVARDLPAAVAAAVNPGPARPLETLLESKVSLVKSPQSVVNLARTNP
jgi:hypothetical protein